jgi:hypothetical protein
MQAGKIHIQPELQTGSIASPEFSLHWFRSPKTIAPQRFEHP